MIIRTKPGAESKKGSAAEGLQELKSAFLKSREQTERLERVIRLCETARAASDRRALGYTALNDTLAAIDYRQAALWWRMNSCSPSMCSSIRRPRITTE